MRGQRRADPAGGDAARRTGPVLTRRQAMGRVTKGAAALGLAAWVTPEILVATPQPAGALSPPPGGSSPGGQPTTSPGGPGSGGPGPTGPGGSGTTGAGSPGSGSAGATATIGASGSLGTSDPGTSAAVGASASPRLQAAAGGSLPFTGFDAVRDAEIGGAMVVGGWLLHRWASHGGGADGATTPQQAGPGPDAG